jgi:hypothetical protein
MTEADLEVEVRGACAERAIAWFHVADSRGMNRGFPDNVIIGRRGLLWRELKSDGGKLSPEQTAIGYALKALGQDWAVWRPVDWHNGTITTELEGIS